MPSENNSSLTEISAEIRNKLQAAMTALESLKAGKKVSDQLVETALKDLSKVIKAIS
jgi:hypothetical protein